MPSPRPLRILGTGVARASREVESLELDQRLGLPSGTVEKRSGVRRRAVEEKRNIAEFCAEAARTALAEASIDLSEIDCLISANASADQAMPCNAALLHRELGLDARGIPAFDINASCLSFLSALDISASLIATQRYRRVLLCSGDLASRALDWHSLDASALFGDGAAAAVLGPCESNEGSALLAARFETYSRGAHFCEIRGGGTRHHPAHIDGSYAEYGLFRMDGKAVFRLVAEQFDRFVDKLLAEAGIGISEIDCVIPHQASALGMAHILRRLNVSPECIVDIFAERGNQVSASLPTALGHAIRSGRLRRGQCVLLIGTAAGVTLGGGVLRH